jgi:hypothetical protein
MTPSEFSIPVELQNLRDQVIRQPEDHALCTKYFWSLHQQMKSFLEEEQPGQAVSCVLEMGQFFIESEKAGNAAGWGVHKILRAFRADPHRPQLTPEELQGLIDVYLKTIPLIPGPDKMHSAILWVTSQMQGEDGYPWFVPLVKAVGIERMQPEDFEGKEVNGYPLPSLAERVVITAAKIVQHDGIQEDAIWALALVEQMLNRKPHNIWLKYHRGRLMLMLGKRTEVRDAARQVVVAKRTEFWAWAVMGESYCGDDDGKCISCLCKVITLKEDEVFLLSIRELLLTSFLRQQRWREARAELDHLVATRLAKNLRVPERIAQLRSAQWYVEAEAGENRDVYIEEARKADDLLFETDPTYIGIVTNIDQKSRSCFVTFRLDGSARYRYHRSPWEKSLPEPGTTVLVRVRELTSDQHSRYEAVSMQPTTSAADRSFAKEFSGILKLIVKAEKDPIGFVGDVFIPGALLKVHPLANGTLIRGTAVKEMNRARGEHGWRAVRVNEVDAASVPPPVPPPPTVEPEQTAPAPPPAADQTPEEGA